MAEQSGDASQIRVEDLAAFVTGLNRFLTRFATIQPFKQAGLGLAEWSALSVIASRQGINSRQLATVLGVSAQRVNQLADSLKGSELVTQTTSTDDARQKILTITPEGSRRLNELNAQLQPLIVAALTKRPRALQNARRLVNQTLMQIIQTQKTDDAG